MSKGNAVVQARKDKPGRFVRVTQTMYAGGEGSLIELQRIFDEKDPEVTVNGDKVVKAPLLALDQTVTVETTPDGISVYNGKLRISRYHVV